MSSHKDSDDLTGLLGEIVSGAAAQEAALYAEPDYSNPSESPAFGRAIAVGKPADLAFLPEPKPAVTIEEARRRLAAALDGYLALDAPKHVLALTPAAGIGKSVSGMNFAEHAATELGLRVLYLAPRHNFFDEIERNAEHPELWYEWQPRREGNPEQEEMCRYAGPIQNWMMKGYAGMDFCAGVCGFDYIKNACPWHAQNNKAGRIVMGQHNHLTSGHPLKFDLVICDEDPSSAFLKEWKIPNKWIMPKGMEKGNPATPLLTQLKEFRNDKVLKGVELLDLLGGAASVLNLTDAIMIPLDAATMAPEIHFAEDAELAPYNHLRNTLQLLNREAREAAQGRDYPKRVILTSNGELILLLRNPVSKKHPKHLVILDATANEHMLEKLLKRPVEILSPPVKFLGSVRQVYTRANNARTFHDADGKATHRVAEMRQMVDRVVRERGYKDVGVVTYKFMVDAFAPYKTTWFGGARGSNALQECDALFVIGTYMPPQPDIVKIASQIYADRMTPFTNGEQMPWQVKPKLFNFIGDDGLPRKYPSPGFWGDEDLAAVLWSKREAEIIQAAHRSSMVLHPTDVWLFTNLHIDQLPPDELLSLHEAMGIGNRVDIPKWLSFMAVVDKAWEEGRSLVVGEIMKLSGLKQTAAFEYANAYFKSDNLRWETRTGETAGGIRGAKPRVFFPIKGGELFRHT